MRASRLAFTPPSEEAEDTLSFRTPKWLSEMPPAAAQRCLEKQAEGVVLPNRNPGAWPGQGLGLMALTKLPHPPPFRKRGSQHYCHPSALTLKGAVLAWLLEWTSRSGKGWGQEEVGRGTACGR